MVVDRRPILEVALVDPQPITGHDVQYPPGMHLARVHDVEGVRPRLVQVDTEYEFRRADRGRPELLTFHPPAWGNHRLVPDRAGLGQLRSLRPSTSARCATSAIPTSRRRRGPSRSSRRSLGALFGATQLHHGEEDITSPRVRARLRAHRKCESSPSAPSGDLVWRRSGRDDLPILLVMNAPRDDSTR